MGRIVSNFFISLDGVVESPEQWHLPFFDAEMGEAIGKGVESTEAMLMGRVLYDEWAAYWPTSDDEPIASTFNEMDKYVVSRTLREAGWSNTTIVGGDVAAGMRDLKGRVAGDITVTGSATLVRWLLSEGLVDRLNLMVHPIAVGKGRRLFEGGATCELRLVSHQAFGTGVLHLGYEPAGA